MTQKLADAIVRNNQAIRVLFTAGFQSALQWRSYLGARFGAEAPSLSAVLDKPGVALSAADFEALFVACFVHRPHAVASFFVPVTEAQAAEIRICAASGRLAAPRDFRFLAGRWRLLFSMEQPPAGSSEAGPHLVIRSEADEGLSWQHLAVVMKERAETGEPALMEMSALKASGGPGVSVRIGEERGPKSAASGYLKLLALIGPAGKIVAAHTAAAAVAARCEHIIQTYAKDLEPELRRRLAALGLPFPISAGVIGGLSPEALAALFREVFIPMSDVLWERSVQADRESRVKLVLSSVEKASEPVRSMAAGLSESKRALEWAEVWRQHREVVTPASLDLSMQAFLSGLPPSPI